MPTANGLRSVRAHVPEVRPVGAESRLLERTALGRPAHRAKRSGSSDCNFGSGSAWCTRPADGEASAGRIAGFGSRSSMIEGHPLLTLALILVAGVLFGQLASRLRLPSVTGQILAGVAIGPFGLGLFHHEQLFALRPVTHFALGLIAVTVGSHLQLSRFLVAKHRLLLLLLFESTLTPLAVGGALLVLFEIHWVVAAILAALAVSTAPATVVALVREMRATGLFVRTLMAAVALNNIACLCLYEIAHSAGRAALDVEGSSWWDIAASPVIAVSGSLGLGSVVGLVLVAATRRLIRSDHKATASMMAILATVGLANWLELSFLLAALALGLVIANATPEGEEVGERVFENFKSAILAIFFTLAGAELDFEYLVPGGLLAVVTVLARIIGKLGASRIAMSLARAPRNVTRNLGLGLIPQAGVAIGLLLSLQHDPAFSSLRALLLAAGLTSVLANELLGPLTMRLALKRSGEVGRDRARLIDFLQEENITTDLRARSLDEAIVELTDLLWKTHRMPSEKKSEFLEAVRAREEEGASYLGGGLATPHAQLEVGDRIRGVMGISHPGIDVGGDREPARCVVLLATPSSQRDRHLEVLAALARAIARDRSIQQQLYGARSPAHAYQLLHAEESESFNYYLDER